MPSSQGSEEKRVVLTLLVVFTFVGLAGAGQTGDTGIAVTWFWMGIGSAVTYLLYRLIVILERIGDDL